MTTTVVISSPSPNHENLKVISQYIDSDGNISSYGSIQVLTDGESCQLHVHGGMRVTITEVLKGPPVVAPAPDPVVEPEAVVPEPEPDAVPLETAAA